MNCTVISANNFSALSWIVSRISPVQSAVSVRKSTLYRPFIFPILVSWPQGEFGAMGLEGAVHLGYRQELAEAPDEDARQALFDKLLAEMYDKGRAVEAASYLEIDAVIQPGETRGVIGRALTGD